MPWATVAASAEAAADPDWAAFVGLTGVVLTLFLALARLSQRAVRSDDDPIPATVEDGDDHAIEHDDPAAAVGGEDLSPPRPTARGQSDPATADLSTGALLANVAFTQGLFGAALLAAAWYTRVPAWALGIRSDSLSTGLPAVAVGTALGVALYAVNELGAASADAAGVEYDERLRAMLAPDTPGGWLVLLFLVLPVVAGVEEFVFRAAVIGATSAGFGTSPWVLAVVSSLAFALGHGAQGRVGVAVTGALGLVLAAAFVLTGSFLVVFVAHYLVNALEFVVHELLGIDWT